MRHSSYVIRADFCWSKSPEEVAYQENGWLVCDSGRSAGVFAHLPGQYHSWPILDYTGQLAVPGLTDLHVHAPQYRFRGTGMDLELLEWLNTETFPEESKYADPSYAEIAYQQFAEDLRRGPNTRACIFATIHTGATLLLMDILEESGLCTMVGRVNMDRNSPPALCEASAAASAADTRAWIQEALGQYRRTKPILTPRFIPSCTDELMQELHQIQQETGLPVQSHLSENPDECAWVQELCPGSTCYGDAYDQFGLFGGPGCPTIMAHCVYSTEEEIALMRERQVYVAHCPDSNTNLSSGIAPIRRYLQEGIPVGLGSDVAAGTQASIFRAMAQAIQVSKLRWRLADPSLQPLNVREAFYLGTVGGGSFFGQVGSFEPGYELDAVVLDDTRYTPIKGMSLDKRLERTIYLSEDQDIRHKFVQGRMLF